MSLREHPQAWRERFLGAMLSATLACVAEAQTLTPSPLESGEEFAGPELRALQQDNLANPGMLWVAQGERLWRQAPEESGKSCAACHGDPAQSMRGVAARYPAIDAASGQLLTLAARINQCRIERQGIAPLRPESDELLSLVALVAFQSRGIPIRVSIDGPARPHFEFGRALYYRRIGQMNLSCAHCHDANWGKHLLNETISQGHGNAYPVYRLSWQNLGSLQRRIRACFSGIRAEMPPANATELVDLELFLAWRATGLAIESPGVRR
jgi:L-cysteine S-thiosulfotransferase